MTTSTDTPDVDPIELNLRLLANTRAEIARAELDAAPAQAEADAIMAPHREKLTNLNAVMAGAKEALLAAMAERRSKRTETVDGIYVTRSERKSVAVVDEAAVLDYIKASGLNPDEYQTLNTRRVTAMAESALKENGEIVPGTETRVAEYISVKEAA